jgi:hypothetical protein
LRFRYTPVSRPYLKPVHDHERGRRRLDHGKLSDACRDVRIPNDSCLCDARRYLFQQFQPFCAQAVLEREKPRRVSTGLRQAIHLTGPNGVNHVVEYNGNGSGRSQKYREYRRPGCDENIGRERNEFFRFALDFRQVATAPSRSAHDSAAARVPGAATPMRRREA